jgi:hypothetical protein
VSLKLNMSSPAFSSNPPHTIVGMSDSGAASAQAKVSTNADPDRVYHLITDLPTLASCAQGAAAMERLKGDAACPGAVFKGRNRNGIYRWSTTCTVTDAQPGQVFAFDVRYLGLPIARWRYDIAGADGGAASPSGRGTAVPAGSPRRRGSAPVSVTATRPTPSTSS